MPVEHYEAGGRGVTDGSESAAGEEPKDAEEVTA